MITMHPVVLHGSSVWNKEYLPEDEFYIRLQKVQKKMKEHQLKGLIIYSDVRNYAGICYFTNYIPKHSYALLFIPAKGEPTLLAKLAGIRDIPYVESITWVKNIRPVKNLAFEVKEFIKNVNVALPADQKSIGIVGKNIMPESVFTLIKEGCRSEPLQETDTLLSKMLHTKRPRELSVIRDAANILNLATNEMREIYQKDGSVVTALVEAERTARNHGAYDVRILYSLDNGKTLQPLETICDTRNDPLVGYIAVQYLGYWVEGMVTLTSRPRPIQKHAEKILDYLQQTLKIGSRIESVVEGANQLVSPYSLHPVSLGRFGHSIGLSLEEEPILHTDFKNEKISENSVYSIHAYLTDKQSQNGLLSAILIPHNNKSEILWSSTDLMYEVVK